MTKTAEKNAAIDHLRELLHTLGTTEHDLRRLSIETLKTLIERVKHVRARAANEKAVEHVANA